MSDIMDTFDNVAQFNAYFEKRWEIFSNSASFFENPSLLLAKFMNRFTSNRNFKNDTTAQKYQEKLTRMQTAMAVGVPDRVPVITSGLNFYPAHYTGISMADFCNDTDKMEKAFLTFVKESTGFDAMFPAHFCHCVGGLIKATQADLVELPGVNLPDNVPYQFVEKERIKSEEFQQLIDRGMDFARETIFPRLTPLYRPKKGFSWNVKANVIKFGWKFAFLYKRLMDIIEKEYGIPMMTGMCFIAPYDVISLFRGLEAISKDIFRRPNMVDQTVDMLVDFLLWFYEGSCMFLGMNSVNLMLERSFSLSPRQFSRFYLPSLKKIINGFAERGILCHIFLEADATQHIASFLEFPPQKFVVHVDKGDIVKVKKVLQGHVCIAGNVPMDLLVTGSTEKVKDYCKMLLQEVAPGGGFILSGALGIPDNAKPENVRAMVEYTLEHGKY